MESRHRMFHLRDLAKRVGPVEDLKRRNIRIYFGDSPEAPKLTRRAYEFAVSRIPPDEQAIFDFMQEE